MLAKLLARAIPPVSRGPISRIEKVTLVTMLARAA